MTKMIRPPGPPGPGPLPPDINRQGLELALKAIEFGLGLIREHICGPQPLATFSPAHRESSEQDVGDTESDNGPVQL